MFWQKEPVETQLDRTIKDLELEVQLLVGGDSKELAKKVKQLEVLHNLRSKNAPKGVSADTWLIVGGNLAGIIIIVVYEHSHVIVSKALGFAGKLR